MKNVDNDIPKKNLYLWLLSFYKPYKNKLLLIIFMSIIISLGELLVPRTIQYFIDNTKNSMKAEMLITILSLLAIVMVISIFSMLIRNKIEIEVREKISFDLQISVIDRVRKLGFSFYETHTSGHILSIVNTDVSAIQRIYNSYIPEFIKQIIMIILTISIALMINPLLTLIVIPCGLLYFILVPYISRKFIFYSKEANENRREWNQKIHETVSALVDLRTNGANEWDRIIYHTKLNRFMHNMKQTILYSCLRFSLRRLTIDIGIIGYFVFGFILYKYSNMSISAIISYNLYYYLVMNNITLILTNINQQQLVLFQARNIYDIFQEKIEVEESINPVRNLSIQGDVVFLNVSFQYQDQKVLNNISLHVHSGKKVAFVGPSGGGKSSILKLVGRFYDPSEGTILIDSTPLSSLSLSLLRSQLGYVMQESLLFNMTVKDNIRFGKPYATDEEVYASAKAALAYEFIMNLPQGFETEISDRGNSISGGQKQRICIARMMLIDPSIIILDEATAALDYETETQVQDSIQHLFTNRTVLCVAHRLSTIRNFDQIYYIDKGSVTEQGTYEELMMRRGDFYNMVTGINGR